MKQKTQQARPKDCGILLPVSALPSPYGIGDFGDEAFAFVDFLAAAGQRYWQVLPLGPTSYGDSPYQSNSAFAGNPYFISPARLCERGLLTRAECDAVRADGDVDYANIFATREGLLRAAFGRFVPTDDYRAFVRDTPWLAEYATYCAVKRRFSLVAWNEWPEEYRDPKSAAVREFAAKNDDELRYTFFVQYTFFTQWRALKDYARSRGIAVIGDAPIYLAFDSAEVWAHKDWFELCGDEATSVAGVPPDYFSADGQRWGNPLYNWQNRDAVFAFWEARLKHSFAMYDVLRIDHFRAFADYYAIPASCPTAREGEWRDGPGKELFAYLSERLGDLPILAEDLGDLSDKARALLPACGFPGMKVLQFGLPRGGKNNPHALRNLAYDFVGYTGTHDNDTARGFYDALPPLQRLQVRLRLLGKPAPALIRALYKSPVKTAIVPMQDFLDRGSDARINIPGTLGGNWKYRLAALPSASLAEKIKKLAEKYRRV